MKDYKENGYRLIKSAFTKEWVVQAQKKLDKMEPKVCLPFSDVSWGFGQLFDVSPFDEIKSNKHFKLFFEELFQTNEYKINHLMASNKSAFIGPEEMWHQEWPNIDTFAPGCNPSKDWEKFTQVVIGIDEMNVNNGCLRIIPKSHELGMVKHQDIVWNNMGHKKRAEFEEVSNAVKKYGIMDCIMEPGDMLFFNHYMLHGSSSNISQFDRKVIIMQVQNHGVEKDMNVFNKYANYRTNFLVKTYQDKINKEMNSNKYADFNKG